MIRRHWTYLVPFVTFLAGIALSAIAETSFRRVMVPTTTAFLRGPVNIKTTDVPAADETIGPQTLNEVEGIWTRTRTQRPGPFVNAFLTGAARKNAENALAQSLSAKASKLEEATHVLDSNNPDNHTVKAEPAGATANHLNAVKTRKKDSAECKSVIKGQIVLHADDFTLVLWDGMANPIETKIELKAGDKKKAEDTDN